jgi:hypothetical protein
MRVSFHTFWSARMQMDLQRSHIARAELRRASPTYLIDLLFGTQRIISLVLNFENFEVRTRIFREVRGGVRGAV